MMVVVVCYAKPEDNLNGLKRVVHWKCILYCCSWWRHWHGSSSNNSKPNCTASAAWLHCSSSNQLCQSVSIWLPTVKCTIWPLHRSALLLQQQLFRERIWERGTIACSVFSRKQSNGSKNMHKHLVQRWIMSEVTSAITKVISIK